MLTSLGSSPTIDFYPIYTRFPKSNYNVINKQTVWNNSDHLVVGSPLYMTSNVNSHQHCDRNRPISSSSVNTNPRTQESLVQRQDSVVLPFKSVNNFISKDGININMGYNDGSSLESIITHKKSETTPEVNPLKKDVNYKLVNQEENPGVTVVDGQSASQYKRLEPLTIKEYSQIKSLKNCSKIGHSRQWGSCGAAVISELKIVDKSLKGKQPVEAKPIITVKEDPCVNLQPLLRGTDMRNKSFCQGTGLKRISQVSLEAEFDSEGRTHEEILIDLRKVHPHTMSAQITLIELSYFKAIKPEEFLSFKWTGSSKHVHAPGIVASTRWFNQLNFWAQRIILECKELTQRSEMLMYIIRVIKKLVDTFNNLSSGMALMSALEMECIHRLKLTWNSLASKEKATFRRLEELFSSENNYEKLRDHINSLKLPGVPYLGLYLTDLTYINIAHSKDSEFKSQTKSDQINNILRTVSEFQQSEYEEPQSPILYRYLESQRYIEELQKIIEDNNYRTSLALEPNIMDPSIMQSSRPSQEVPVVSTPQKTPNANYGCRRTHSEAYVGDLQSPISPKPLSIVPHNESIKEVTEQTSEDQLLSETNLTNSKIAKNNGDCVPSRFELSAPKDNITPSGSIDHYKRPVGPEYTIVSGQLPDEDNSVRMSLLCATGRRSQYKKRSINQSIRFKRDSSFASNNTMTNNITKTNSGNLDKLMSSHPSKSLLDDSYLDATTTETCSEAEGQTMNIRDVPIITNLPTEIIRSPPICQCVIKRDIVDITPKSSLICEAEFSNLLNIVHAAESATKINDTFNNTLSGCSEVNFEEFSNSSIKLVCQGVLLRKTYAKNSKRSKLSMWNRYWVVLMISKESSFLAFFENSQLHATERKHFKSNKCLVQDLKEVIVSREAPVIQRHSFVHNKNVPRISYENDQTQKMKKFFLTDNEYGTIYKFKDTSSASSKKSHNDVDEGRFLRNEAPSLFSWYRLLKRSISLVNNQVDDSKDLIVLGDS